MGIVIVIIIVANSNLIVVLIVRPNNRIAGLEFADVVAERDERGALSLPITAPPPVTAALSRVRGRVLVRPAARGVIGAADVRALGEQVELRCPVAAGLRAGGCDLEFEWLLDDSCAE